MFRNFTTPITLFSLMIALLNSCAHQKTDCTKCEEYYQSVQTAKQGQKKAKSDIIEHGYSIYRYDMPGFRTGYWGPYYARFKHFGIKEKGGSFGIPTLEYMRSYNQTMDTRLKQKYGSEYLKYRHKLMPRKGAVIYSYTSNRSTKKQ